MATVAINQTSMTEEPTEEEGEVQEERTVMCEVCRQVRRKYTCPRCAVHTCSLPCVLKHKRETGCSGKRDKTAFVAKEDYTDSQYRSDFFFLEEIKREVENKDKGGLPGMKMSRNFSAAVLNLRRNAKKRGVFIDFMPVGMSREVKNKSIFDFTTQMIHWSVEWRFPAENVVFFDERIPDVEVIQDLLEGHIRKHQELEASTASPGISLQAYSADSGRSYAVLLKIYGKNKYYMLDKTESLHKNLNGRRLVEFPTIYVVKEVNEKYPVLSPEAEQQAMQETRPRYYSAGKFGRHHYSQSRGRGQGRGRGRGRCRGFGNKYGGGGSGGGGGGGDG